MRTTSSCVKTMPPLRLCVFSISTRVLGAYTGKERGLIAASSSAALNTPRLPISTSCTPAFAAEPPVSCQPAWHSRLTIASSPGRVRTRNATWLAIVPEGSQRAASLPSISAMRACSRLQVGSSPY